jgi:hypothetical protein
MSKWTHIAGIIRIDHIPIVTVLTEAQVENIFNTQAPTGSEGPLLATATKTQIMTPHGGPLVWGYVTIYGDLRDFGDTDDIAKISKWLDDSVHTLQQEMAIIRQGIVGVEIENGHILVYVFKLVGEKVAPVWECREVK